MGQQLFSSCELKLKNVGVVKTSPKWAYSMKKETRNQVIYSWAGWSLL